MERETKILIISSDERLKEILTFCFDGWGYEVSIQNHAAEDIMPIKRIAPDVIVVDVQSAHKNDLKICRMLKDDFVTALIPVITIINKRHLRDHLLDLKHGVDDYVIKPPDPLDLRVRIEMAIRRSHYNLYASALTGLPGGRIIEETLKERFKKNCPFAFAYLDIDSFKYFNDVYGYVNGDQVILHTAYIVYSVLGQYGNPGDVIGHIGGDDFVYVTTPEKAPILAEQIIRVFDRTVPFHYHAHDRHKGFIIARDRTHTVARVPLMSLSIAIVNREKASPYKNIIEINDRIAEVKRYLKGIAGSKYMIDRRDADVPGGVSPHLYKSCDHPLLPHKPLGQLLVEKNLISQEQLNDALRTHWRKGIILGEVLKESGLVGEEDIVRSLKLQKSLLEPDAGTELRLFEAP